MTPGANDLCVFAVKRGSIDNRIDPHFYLPIFQSVVKALNKRGCKRLGEIASFSKDITDYCEFPQGQFDYLEIAGVILGMNAYNTTKVSVDNAPSRAKMKTKPGDIVISTTRPNRGAIAEIRDEGIIASTGFSVIRSVDPKVDKNWLIHALLSNCCLLQMLQRSSGGNYPAITEDELKQILLPDIDRTIQEETVIKLEEKLKERNQKLQKANTLLRENPTYLLIRLGLKFDFISSTYAYGTKLNRIDGRLDADYYSPRFAHFRKQIEELPYSTVSIDDIADRIVTGFAAGKQDQADDLPEEKRVPHLRPFSVTSEGELSFETQKYVPNENLRSDDYCKKGEIIFNNTNSPDLVGKTAVFDSDVLCAASNHMTRITVKDGVNPYYVASFFNLLLSIGYWKLLCTNFNNQAGINTETLKKVRIPLPEKGIQDQIATELMQRRSQANILRKEAQAEWKAAKQQFERELLGE